MSIIIIIITYIRFVELDKLWGGSSGGGSGPGGSERVKTCSIKSLTEEPHNRASRYYTYQLQPVDSPGKTTPAKHSRLVDLQQAARCLSQQPAIVLEGSVADYLSRGRGAGEGKEEKQLWHS